MIAPLAALFLASVQDKEAGGSGTLRFEGRSRGYFIIAPEETEGAPLMLLLHGGGGDGEKIARIARVAETARRAGFIAVCPDGIENRWNDGRVDGLDVDDVGFLCALAESIAAEHGADERRMYIAGASNGGMMAFRTVLERPGIFAAAAGVMASLPESLEFDYADAGPIPVLFVNGTADPVLPYNGGEVRIQRQTYGRVRPVQEAVDFWVQRNRCENPPAREVPEQTPSEEGLSVVKWTYSGGDADVVLCKVEGGGHTWPGGMQYAPEFVIGKTYRGWSATETIWRFFKKQSRREA